MLGVGKTDQYGLWMQHAGPSVFAVLATRGITPVKDPEHMDGVGSFAWIEDPEGNRIELWQGE